MHSIEGVLPWKDSGIKCRARTQDVSVSLQQHPVRMLTSFGCILTAQWWSQRIRWETREIPVLIELKKWKTNVSESYPDRLMMCVQSRLQPPRASPPCPLALRCCVHTLGSETHWGGLRLHRRWETARAVTLVGLVVVETTVLSLGGADTRRGRAWLSLGRNW